MNHYYIQRQWRVTTDEGQIVFRDTKREADKELPYSGPDLVFGVFYGPGPKFPEGNLIADCYTRKDAVRVRDALKRYYA